MNENSENQGGAGPLDIEALEMGIHENHFLNEPKALALLARIRELERLRPSLPQGSPAAGDVHVRVHCSPDASPEVQEALGHAIAGAIKVAREKQKGAEGSVLREAVAKELVKVAGFVMAMSGSRAEPISWDTLPEPAKEQWRKNADPLLAILKSPPARPQEDGPSPALDLTKEIEAIRSYIARSAVYYLTEGGENHEEVHEMAEWGLSRIQYFLATPKPPGAAAPGSQGGRTEKALALILEYGDDESRGVAEAFDVLMQVRQILEAPEPAEPTPSPKPNKEEE